jgi:hypothetical protein
MSNRDDDLIAANNSSSLPGLTRQYMLIVGRKTLELRSDLTAF